MICPTGDQEVAGSTLPGQQLSFVEIDHEIFFYIHYLPSADSRREVVSFRRKNVQNSGKLLRGISLPSKSVVRKTDHAGHDHIGLTWP